MLGPLLVYYLSIIIKLLFAMPPYPMFFMFTKLSVPSKLSSPWWSPGIEPPPLENLPLAFAL